MSHYCPRCGEICPCNEAEEYGDCNFPPNECFHQCDEEHEDDD